jgi:hypothetical protein
MYDDYEYDGAETHAVILIPGWRHRSTGKLHIRRDCRAVMYREKEMIPVLVRFDDEREITRAMERGVCRYCFPGGAI